MKIHRVLTPLLFVFSAASLPAQETTPSIATDRPGFTFSSLTVGRGVAQLEAGLPTVAFTEGDIEVRTINTPLLLRYGVGRAFELRLGSPLLASIRTETGRSRDSDSGFGDLEVGAKWHLLDQNGARPSFALIPSVILPVGEEGFSIEEPAYLLNTATEWTLDSGLGIAALAGVKHGDTPDGECYNETSLALALSRSLTSAKWNLYGEAAFVTNDLAGSDAWYAGGGAKYLLSKDVQLDLSFDRGLSDDAADWLLGLGLSGRF